MSREERVTLIEWQREALPVKTQADLLSLNRSSLYYRPVPPSAEEVVLKHRIDEIYTAHPYYGYRRITAQLQRDGLEVNRKAVARHMREMGLAAVYPGPNLSKRAHQAAIYPYLLANITASTPNHVWGIDITYIRLRSSWMYLVAVLDWYSRYVVSWLRHEVASVAVEADKQHSTWCSTTSTLPRPASGVIPGWEALGTMYPFSIRAMEL